MTKLTDLTIRQALDGMANGDFTSEELTNAHIKAVDEADDLNAFITKTPELALQQAKASDARRRDAKALGWLDGIPLAMKDLYCTKGIKTTAGSAILGNFVPHYESTVSQNMTDNGMVMLGKASLDQFAMGSSNTTSAFGNALSPWKANTDGANDFRVPGGSSGGSAAAVAARIAMGATGTDTGGSIRQPSSFCGITGIKPTYGRCSRWGIIAYASSLDQAGPMARTVEDCAIMLNAMAGYDAKDSTSVDIPVPDYTRACVGNVKGKKIGIPKEYRVDGMPEEIEKFWQQSIAMLKDQGAEIVDISLPHTKYALPTYYIIAPAECSSNLARYDGMRYGQRVEGSDLTDTYELSRAAGFGIEVKRRIMIGTYVLSAGYYDAYYLKAQRVRALIAQDFKNAFEKVDAILTPPAPSSAFKVGENEDDPVKMYLNDVFTIPASLAGLPGMVVPVGIDSAGLPIGMQILGNRWNEEEVFNVATALERAAHFTAKPNYKTVA